MCRFVLYLGEPIVLENLLAKPVNSLINQSFDARLRDTLNGDGFGVAWYVPDLSDAPAVYKSLTPAWSNRNLLHLGRVTRTHCALAHVRAATPGVPVHEINCHPFVAGSFTFMHNGEVGGYAAIRRDLLNLLSEEAFNGIEGSTDSEHLFALFLDGWRRHAGLAPLEAMAAAVQDTIATVLRLQQERGVTGGARLNMAVSDGRRAVVSHFADPAPNTAPTLFWHEGRRYVCEGGVARMIDADVRSDTVIVASEPLSADPGWAPVATNSLMLIDETHQVTMRPIGGDGARAIPRRRHTA
jgi:predicted glutamine amidotransferase